MASTTATATATASSSHRRVGPNPYQRRTPLHNATTKTPFHPLPPQEEGSFPFPAAGAPPHSSSSSSSFRNNNNGNGAQARRGEDDRNHALAEERMAVRPITALSLLRRRERHRTKPKTAKKRPRRADGGGGSGVVVVDENVRSSHGDKDDGVIGPDPPNPPRLFLLRRPTSNSHRHLRPFSSKADDADEEMGAFELGPGVTELSGSAGSGKTQLVLGLCVSCASTPCESLEDGEEDHGSGREYIDASSTPTTGAEIETEVRLSFGPTGTESERVQWRESITTTTTKAAAGVGAVGIGALSRRPRTVRNPYASSSSSSTTTNPFTSTATPVATPQQNYVSGAAAATGRMSYDPSVGIDHCRPTPPTPQLEPSSVGPRLHPPEQRRRPRRRRRYYEALYVSMGEGLAPSQVTRRLGQMAEARSATTAASSLRTRASALRARASADGFPFAWSSSSSCGPSTEVNCARDILTRIRTRHVRNEDELVELVTDELPALLRRAAMVARLAAVENEEEDNDEEGSRGSGGRIGLVAFDSVAGLFRTAEDCADNRGGRTSFFQRRSSVLFRLSSQLRRLSDDFGVRIVVVNQVTSSLSSSSALGNAPPSGHRPTAEIPALGLSWSNCVNTRYLLTRTETTVAVGQTTLAESLSSEQANRCSVNKVVGLPSSSGRGGDSVARIASTGTRFLRHVRVALSSSMPSGELVPFVIENEGGLVAGGV